MRLHSILDPFEQADVSHTRRFGGTGLGLSISKSLCELMGGKLEINSAPNQGSSFEFSIIMTEGTPLETTPALADSQRSNSATGAPSILLADDDETGQAVAKFMLKKLGYTCDTATDGQQVVDAVAAKNYDIVFMDIQMPRMDGLEATSIIHAMEKPSPWIIGLTANATIESKVDCQNAGMNDYLSKPVKQIEIDNAINRAMKARS